MSHSIAVDLSLSGLPEERAMEPRRVQPPDEAPLYPSGESVMHDDDHDVREAVADLVSYAEQIHRRVSARSKKNKNGTDDRQEHPRADLRDQASGEER